MCHYQRTECADLKVCSYTRRWPKPTLSRVGAELLAIREIGSRKKLVVGLDNLIDIQATFLCVHASALSVQT